MRFIIEGYVNQIKSDDIIKFASSNNILISEEEALFLKGLLKSHLDDVLSGNDAEVLQIIESHFDNFRFTKMKNLYLIYKDRYKSYL